MAETGEQVRSCPLARNNAGEPLTETYVGMSVNFPSTPSPFTDRADMDLWSEIGAGLPNGPAILLLGLYFGSPKYIADKSFSSHAHCRTIHNSQNLK